MLQAKHPQMWQPYVLVTPCRGWPRAVLSSYDMFGAKGRVNLHPAVLVSASARVRHRETCCLARGEQPVVVRHQPAQLRAEPLGAHEMERVETTQ